MALPLVVLFLSTLLSDLPRAAVLVLALTLAVLTSFVASRAWERHSPTAVISFSELMIWSWYRLQKAERRLMVAQDAAKVATSHEEQIEVLHELTAALESKDPYTRGHSRRVERHCFMTGVAMGLPLKDVEVLRMAASLHDVGKIRISNKILHNPGRLSDDERAVIEEHPVIGARMVASTGDEQIVSTVRHHHERWDGKGYPDGRAGTDIPLFSRIIAVADSYDAIRSTRSYRAGASREKAVGILHAESSSQFDPDVVEAFMTTLPARRPLVAAMMILSQPAALWRYLKRLFHRFGSTGLAPVLGVLGAVAFMMVSPDLAPRGPLLERSPLKPASMRNVPAPIAIDAVTHSNESRAQQAADRRNRKAQDARADRRRQAERSDAGAARTAQRQQNASQVAAAGAGDSGSTEASGTESDLSSVDDPNVEGRDCKGAKSSKGSRLHCR